MSKIASCVIAAIIGMSMMATTSAAQTARPKARPAATQPAAPVTLLRNDADLFAATLAGRYAQGTSNPQLAAQAWSRAFMRRPTDMELFERALEANLNVGNIADAVRIAKLVAPSQRNEQAALILAVDAFTTGRYSEVTRLLTGRSFQPSQRLFVNHLNAYGLLGQGKGGEAVELTVRPTGVSALDKIALASRAMILNQAGRREEAGILFQSSFDSGVASPVAIRAYSNWLVANGRKADAIDIYVRMVKAGGIEASGFASSLAQLQTSTQPPIASDLRSIASAGLTTIAQGLAEQGRGGEPIVLFNLTTFLDPRSDAASIALAQQLIAQSRGDDAKPILSRIPSTSVEYLAARTELAWLIIGEEPAGAVTIARELLRSRPNDTSAKRLLADVLAATRGDGEAEGLYSSLINNARAAGQSNEEMWPLYFGRGGSRERQGNWTGALSDLRFAKNAAPNQPNVLNYLGYALADRGESLDEALVMLRTAVRLRPRSGSIQDSLGWAQFKAGQYEEAVSTLEAAANLSPALAEISDHLGDAYWRSGREDEARMEWTRTLRLTVTQTQKESVTRKIQDGLPALNAPVPTRAIAAQTGRNTN